MSWLSDLLGDVSIGLLPDELKNLYGTFGDDGVFTPAYTSITPPDITFQPFTVAGPTGGVTAGPKGTTYKLSSEQQAIQDALMGSALGRFQQGQPAGSLASTAAGQQAMALGQQALGATPFGVGQQQAAAQQAFGLGGQFMGASGTQPADVQALRQQYGGLASQAAMDVLTPTAAREGSVYERIRATQRPEEERQRLALEERLASQGRLGVRTAMYGGTPEQFAMAKAQEEAQDRASLAAMQQAQAERQQALGTAQTLGGMFSQQATLGGALQAQQAGLGAQYAGLGSTLAAQQQALGAAQQSQALQALTGGQGLLSGGLGLETAQQQLGIGALQAGYAPQAALLSAMSPALNVASMADVARRQQGEFDLETAMANAQTALGLRQAQGGLYAGIYSGLLGGLGGLFGGGSSKPWWLP
jgi:hypothetical protein